MITDFFFNWRLTFFNFYAYWLGFFAVLRLTARPINWDPLKRVATRRQVDVRCCFSHALKITKRINNQTQLRNSRPETGDPKIAQRCALYKSLRVKRKLPKGYESNLDVTEVNWVDALFGENKTADTQSQLRYFRRCDRNSLLSFLRWWSFPLFSWPKVWLFRGDIVERN